MDLVLFPDGPAARGRKAASNADDHDENPCRNGEDLVDHELILVMRFPAGERIYCAWKRQSKPRSTWFLRSWFLTGLGSLHVYRYRGYDDSWL